MFTLKDDLEIGAYNIFLDGCVLYQRGSESLQSAHDLFKGALPGGFAWELTEPLSGTLSLSLSLSLSLCFFLCYAELDDLFLYDFLSLDI